MQRILLLGDIDEAGGTGAYFKRMAAFLGSNYQLHIVLRKGQDTATLRSYLENVKCTVSIYLSRLEWFEKYTSKVFSRLGIGLPYAYLRDMFLFPRIVKKTRTDLIFISQGGGVNYFSTLLLRKPTVIVCHSLFVKPIVTDLWGYSFLKLFARLDATRIRLLHVSETSSRLFRKNIESEVLAKASIVVHNFGSSFWTARKKEELIRIKTMGHVVEYKNPLLWIEVARRLNEQYPGRLMWTWAGTGSMLKKCKEVTRPDSNICFVGFQNDVAALYADCDIYFQPSIWENHSISIVEAMGAGIPCVVSNAGGSPESIRNDEEGFVCEPNSIEGYLDAFSRLIEDPSLRKKMGERARERFKTEFSYEKWSEKMKKVISSII